MALAPPITSAALMANRSVRVCWTVNTTQIPSGFAGMIAYCWLFTEST